MCITIFTLKDYVTTVKIKYTYIHVGMFYFHFITIYIHLIVNEHASPIHNTTKKQTIVLHR